MLVPTITTAFPNEKIYKTYPVYAPAKEPPGYLDWLKQQEPEIVFDATKLKTEGDWIRADELVFETDTGIMPVTPNTFARNPALYEHTHPPLTREGLYPFARYVIREKGKVESGVASCASCHTRVLPDGTAIKGAQGNSPIGQIAAFNQALSFTSERFRRLEMTACFRISAHSREGRLSSSWPPLIVNSVLTALLFLFRK
jgi:hypothetical protein